jgi:serine/threonine-protein kinase
MPVSLADVAGVEVDIETYLNSVGEVFRAFRDQDSTCISYGVLSSGRRWFVKHSDHPQGLASLKRAYNLNNAVCHDAMPRLYNRFKTPDGVALVYDWVPGELLSAGSQYTAEQLRTDLTIPRVRFWSLPVDDIVQSLNTIFDVQLTLADHGYTAVDMYDGCFNYDFETSRTYVFDLDEYRVGPFVLDSDRLPGSRRFMAPEEWTKGVTIDQVTNVFTLGRTAAEFLGRGSTSSETWMGSSQMRAVTLRAISQNRWERHQSVREFVTDWRRATNLSL